MKIIERDIEGYSEKSLKNSASSFLYKSPATNKMVPVRGVCFATGGESSRLAHEFAGNYLGIGLLGLRMSAMTAEVWQGITAMLIQHSAEVMNVGFLLNALDLVAPGLEQAMADVIDKTENVHWLATAGDPRMIHPKLRVMFLVYLGLGQNGRMRYLPHDEQRLLIDKGSLIKAKK